MRCCPCLLLLYCSGPPDFEPQSRQAVGGGGQLHQHAVPRLRHSAALAAVAAQRTGPAADRLRRPRQLSVQRDAAAAVGCHDSQCWGVHVPRRERGRLCREGFSLGCVG